MKRKKLSVMTILFIIILANLMFNKDTASSYIIGIVCGIIFGKILATII